MAISLEKGGNISLTKVAPNLQRVAIGLGWDARGTDGADFDLDASAFMLTDAGSVRTDADFIFYNQPKSLCGSVVHQGDNLTGHGAGDDEVVNVDLPQVPTTIVKLAVAVTIHEGEARGQNFGMVSNAFIRLVDRDTGEEVARYDLSEDACVETGMIFGEVYRRNNEWKFRAVGQGFAGGLRPLVMSFGVNI